MNLSSLSRPAVSGAGGALDFLSKELGLTDEERRELCIRFPHVLSYGVQVWESRKECSWECIRE